MGLFKEIRENLFVVFTKLKKNIDSVNFANILGTANNTTANRKYFMYGCALHPITDVFAHSTAINNVRINHKSSNGADDWNYYKGRSDLAVKVASYALKEFKNGVVTDGCEVLKAIKSQYSNVTPDFQIIFIKRYLNENRYSDAVLNKIDCSIPRYTN